MNYIPNSFNTTQEMLQEIGVESFDQLVDMIPENLKYPEYSLSEGLSEPAVLSLMKDLASKNYSTSVYHSYMGAGAYEAYIPAALKALVSRGEFLTAYTPYQPEVSQGTLQMIYEYQTMICGLTGMEVANASLYDGGSAVAEGCLMATRIHPKRKKILVSRSLHPHYIQILKTYFYELPYELVLIDFDDEGKVSAKDIEQKMDSNCVALVVQYPNFFGVIEPIPQIYSLIKEHEILMIGVSNILPLSTLRSPSSLGIDISVGEAQIFGNDLNFGGPYLGYIASKMSHVRKMPGRIVGQTEDEKGRRGFVLTFQAREQHIRREKATSNICTNQGLMALKAAIYMSFVGKSGLQKIANKTSINAHYLSLELDKIGIKKVFNSDFFNEFVVQIPSVNLHHFISYMKENKILPGVHLNQWFCDMNQALMIYTDELKSKKEMDDFVELTKKYLEKYCMVNQ